MSFTFIDFCKCGTVSQEAAQQTAPWSLQGACRGPAPAFQSRWDLSACTRSSAQAVYAAWWLPTAALHPSFPLGRIKLLLQPVIQMPPSGEEPGDLFYEGQTDVNSFSTKISAPLLPSQML